MAAPTDVHEESKTEQVLCEIEATVPTGFEELARDEIAEKLGTKGTVVRGRVNFFLPKERAKEVRKHNWATVQQFDKLMTQTLRFNVIDCMRLTF